MERKDNFRIQADNAKQTFLGYDQQKLIRKLHLRSDEGYLYMTFLSEPYRIHRRTADISRQVNGSWVDGNSYEEVMTLLDLICDSREDRCLAHRWKNTQGFGLQIHQNLVEDANDPDAKFFSEHLNAFRHACAKLGSTTFPLGDAAYVIEIFDGLPMAIQLWLEDDDFPSQLRILWDENADQYLRYETMFFAIPLVLRRIRENMEVK